MEKAINICIDELYTLGEMKNNPEWKEFAIQGAMTMALSVIDSVIEGKTLPVKTKKYIIHEWEYKRYVFERRSDKRVLTTT